MIVKLGESSNIKKVEYNPETKTLTITFMNDITYEYYNIELNIILDWQKAESVGKFFAEYIRNKKYKRIN